jgi:hypothetical protein
MKNVILIRVGPTRAGVELWKHLRDLAPGILGAHRWEADFVPEDNSEVVALRACLREAGIRESDTDDDKSTDRRVTTIRKRLFDHEDLCHASAMLIKPIHLQPVASDRGNVDDQFVLKSVRTPVAAVFGGTLSGGLYHRMWVLSKLIDQLKADTWKGVVLHPAYCRDDDDDDGHKGITTWDGAKELSSTVVLPPVAFGPIKTMWDGNCTQTQDVVKRITGMHDEGFRDVVPRFYAREMSSLGEWDIAISYEEIMGPRNRYLYVSQRVYKTFRALNLDHLCDWKPCEIIDGERPPSA